MQTDWRVGEILCTLDETETTVFSCIAWTTTMMLAMPKIQKRRPIKVACYRANNHLRDTKVDIWEAGQRVPFFARRPSNIAWASTCQETVCHVDLMATCPELLGHELPENATEDSFSWMPLFKGHLWTSPRAPVINFSAGGIFASRVGPWKLKHGNGSGGCEQLKGKPDQGPLHISHLYKNLQELHDLASHYPDKAS